MERGHGGWLERADKWQDAQKEDGERMTQRHEAKCKDGVLKR